MTSRQAHFDEFTRPESELDSLLLALLNMLAAYREQDTRFHLDPDEDTVRSSWGFRSEFDGNFSQIETRLNNKLSCTPYKAITETGMSVEALDGILENGGASLPIVELHTDYYEELDNDYFVQPGQFQKIETPVLIPVMVEDDLIIYWDPYFDYFQGSDDGTNEMTISRNIYVELWSRADRTRWTLWIERTTDQDTLARFTEEDTQ